MSKKSRIDDLCEAVVEDKVLSVLINKLTTIFTPLIESTVKQMAADITKEVTKEVTASLTVTMEQLCQTKFAKSDEQFSAIHQDLASLKTNNTILAGRIDELDRHSKLANLIIHGIPHSPPTSVDNDQANPQSPPQETDHSLKTAVIQLFHTDLNINVSEQDISMVHRLPAKKNDQRGPTIVSFVNRRIRNEIYRAKKLLRTNCQLSGTKQLIFINEHLTQPTAQIFASARKMVREKHLASCWSNRGFVYIKKSAEATESPKRILFLDDLEKFIQ